MLNTYTAISFLVDASGSMAHLTRATIGSYNAFLKEQKEVPGDATITLALFSDRYELIHDAIPLKDAPELNEATYRPNGSTALLDAVGRSVVNFGRFLSSLPEHKRTNSKKLCVILTDGEENASIEYKHVKIKEMVSHHQDVYNWQFVFIGASNIDAFSSASSIGISKNSTYGYTASAVGTRSLYDSLSLGVSEFRSSPVACAFNMADPNQSVQAQSTPVVVGTSIPANGVVVPSPTSTTVSVSPTDTNDTK